MSLSYVLNVGPALCVQSLKPLTKLVLDIGGILEMELLLLKPQYRKEMKRDWIIGKIVRRV